jgi:hypothetical protein
MMAMLFFLHKKAKDSLLNNLDKLIDSTFTWKERLQNLGWPNEKETAIFASGIQNFSTTVIHGSVPPIHLYNSNN